MPKTYVVKIQQEAIHGTLDLHVCILGFFLAIELKSDPKTPLEPRQKYEADLIEKAEGIVMRVDPLNWPGTYLKLEAFANGIMTLEDLAS